MATTSSPRARRLAERIRRLVSEYLESAERDQRIGFVTVTDVRASSDLRRATVYYTVLGDAGEQESTAKLLAETSPQIRSHVATNTSLKFAPVLEFTRDDVREQGARIDRLLAEVVPESGPAEEAPDGPPTVSPYRVDRLARHDLLDARYAPATDPRPSEPQHFEPSPCAPRQSTPDPSTPDPRPLDEGAS